MVRINMKKPVSCTLCNFCKPVEYGEYGGEDRGFMCLADCSRIGNDHYLDTNYIREDCPITSEEGCDWCNSAVHSLGPSVHGEDPNGVAALVFMMRKARANYRVLHTWLFKGDCQTIATNNVLINYCPNCGKRF